MDHNDHTPGSSDPKLYTISIFTENHVGLLNQLSIIFFRRGLNIESVTASRCSIEGVHKITITCISDRRSLQKAVAAIERRIDVIKAFLYTDDEVLHQEVALYKVPTQTILQRGGIEAIMRDHGARVLEMTPDYTVLEKTGHNDETEALFHVLKDYGITQFVRSGRVAITRSPEELVDRYLERRENQRRNSDPIL